MVTRWFQVGKRDYRKLRGVVGDYNALEGVRGSIGCY